MEYKIERRELTPEPVLLTERRVKRTEIASTIAACLPLLFQYAQKHGVGLTGLPLTRYTEWGPGVITMQPAMRIAPGATEIQSGDGVMYDELPGGSVVFTLHCGPYDQLHEAYASMEQWMHDQKLKSAGAPWECYITDPGEFPNPQDWKTEVYWPVAD